MPVFARLKDVTFFQLGPLYLTSEPVLISLLFVRTLILRARSKGLTPSVPRWVLVVLLSFVVFTLPSVLSAPYFDESLTAYWEGVLAPLLLVPVVTTLVRSRTQITQLLWAIWGQGLISVAYALYQYYRNPGWRITSVYYSPAIFGQILAFIIPITVALIFLTSHKILKFLLLVFLLISFVVVLLCVTRTDFFVTPLGLSLFLLFRLRSRGFLKAATLGLGSVLLMIVLVAPLRESVTRHLYFQDPALWLDPGASGSEHLNAWKASIKMTLEYPLGIGPSMFQYYYYRFQPAEGITFIEHSHNLFLGALCELGVVAGVCFFLLYCLFVILAFRLFKRLPTKDSTIPLMCGTVLICYGLTAWSGGEFVHLHLANPLYLYWIVVAVLFVVLRPAHNNSSSLGDRVTNLSGSSASSRG
jgi:O-antigen ligase